MIVLEVIDGSSHETLLEPGVVSIGNTIHIEEYLLHHEDDFTILWLLVVANGVTFFHQGNKVLRSLVFADLGWGLLQLELLHRDVGVLCRKENVAHFEVLWLSQVEHYVHYLDNVITSG